MSKISDIYDALDSLISTALPAYTKLPNAYDLEENPELFLKRGYGIAIGSGENTKRELGCRLSYLRQFTIGLIKQITTTDTNTAARVALEKAIIEDHYLVLKALENDVDLNETSNITILPNDNGIEYLEGETNKYFLVTITVTSEYSENL